MRIENWCGMNIRFVDVDGEWWAVLKDICDALRLKTFHVTERIDPDMMKKVTIEASDIGSKEVSSNWHARHSQRMLVVNEQGIYEALFASRRLEARQFRKWAGSVMQKLRKTIGLQGYEVMRMTEPEIQEEIDFMLDTLYWDDEKKCVMQSVTVRGGDVEQIPFLGE